MTRDILARSRPPASLVWLIRFWSSIPDFVRSGVLVAAAIAVGLIAWSGEPRLLPAAMLFPALWALAPTRFCAALVAEGYFLVASRGLPQGVANFYGSGFEAGIVLWIAASSLFVAVHAIAWTARPGRGRAIRYAIGAILLSVPPIGIVGWARNRSDGSVEILAEGPASSIRDFIEWCRRGPPAARVRDVVRNDEAPCDDLRDFLVR